MNPKFDLFFYNWQITLTVSYAYYQEVLNTEFFRLKVIYLKLLK